ncbi:hypothetical protein [Kordiimonas sp.]|uniref:hypothetical protein n=1 Tax=Kordiimonas sp. TaxID=1970157 RepID=UPI003A95A2FA
MDTNDKIYQHLEQMDDAQSKDGDALLKELEDRYDTPRETLEKIIADWMAGAKPADKNK